MRGLKAIFTLFVLGSSLPCWAESGSGSITDPAAAEKKARESLAKTLEKLGKSPDMREAKFDAGKGGGGKLYDSNNGNSFLSNTTIHYDVESTCERWVGGAVCARWLDPYISRHGFGPDYSPLEGMVAQQWVPREGLDNGNQYAIWQIQRNDGGPNKDADGKLILDGISDWRLSPDVRQNIEKVGEQTATRQIALTYDDNAPKGGNTMPNMESLRMMATRWTKMFRNRLLGNLADMRTGDTPTEFLNNEDRPDCESYMQAMASQQEETRTEERLRMQAKLDPDTIFQGLQQRYQACVALRNASYSMVNAQARGRNVYGGNPDSERVDKWRTRVNIALIDRPSRDPNSIPKPRTAVLTRADLTSDTTQWEEGGRAIRKKKKMTNREVFRSYNRQLDSAAAGMKEVASRSSSPALDSSLPDRYKIQPGKYRWNQSLVQLNGFTDDMISQLADTSMQKAPELKGGPQLEDNATQIAILGR